VWKELRALTSDTDAPATRRNAGANRGVVGEGRQKKEIAALAGVSRPTVDLWLSRFAAGGVPGLLDRRRGAPREQMPAAIRGRVLAQCR
jgi:transposase